jgi:fatty acid synthase subunit alpha, fungi type
MVSAPLNGVCLFSCLSVTFPAAPHTEISEKGEIVYSEANRENVHKFGAYVEEMCSAAQISGSVNIQKIQDDVIKLYIVKSRPEISEEQKNRIKALYDGVVRSLRKAPDNRLRPGIPRTCRSSSQFLWPQLSGITSMSADKIPLLHLKHRMGTQWEYDSNLSGVYFGVLHKIRTSGTTFKDKNALITVVGRAPFAVRFSKVSCRAVLMLLRPPPATADHN